MVAYVGCLMTMAGGRAGERWAEVDRYDGGGGPHG